MAVTSAMGELVRRELRSHRGRSAASAQLDPQRSRHKGLIAGSAVLGGVAAASKG
jgi:hypothetical protein